ncbi:DUF5367 domain-containing protein [Flavobacterium sp. N1736]|uniref:DUF5367 domain-containing protein n=1 Tax=Flavobacterium sp. N1736 TaxID=2986823 RepID=UPI00222487CA|nr:DUF5367 domain-containing protein [Flavobacterium sp. N1736]
MGLTPEIIAMKYLQILLPGVFIWVCVSLSFYILSFVPLINNSFKSEAVIVMIMMVLYANEMALVYYKNGIKIHGLLLGIIMSMTALILDALITVPFIEIPNGRTYSSFFCNPVLCILISINLVTVYYFWRIKIKTKT